MAMSGQPNVSLLTDEDVYLFNEGSHFCLYEKLGAHVVRERTALTFSVWAPNAEQVSPSSASFNRLGKNHATCCNPKGDSGIWQGIFTRESAKESSV